MHVSSQTGDLTVRGNMIQAGPLEEQFACGDIQLCSNISHVSLNMPIERTLNDGINDPLLVRASTPSTEVPSDGLVDLDEARLLIDNVEFVLVNQLVVSRTQLANGLVVLIHEGNVPMAVAVASVMVTLEAEENVLALPAAGLEVGGPNAVQRVARPDEIAIVPENVWSSLEGPMLLSRSVGLASKGGEKEISLLDIARGWNRDVQTRRRQVWAASKLPVGRDMPKEHCRSNG